MHVFTSTQHPGEVQHMVAHALGMPTTTSSSNAAGWAAASAARKRRCRCSRASRRSLARKTGRAVKLRLDRDDDMRSTGKRHAFSTTTTSASTTTAASSALDLTLASRCGFSADLSGPVNDRAVFHVDNCYWLPNVAIHSYRCKTQHRVRHGVSRLRRTARHVRDRDVIDDIARALALRSARRAQAQPLRHARPQRHALRHDGRGQHRARAHRRARERAPTTASGARRSRRGTATSPIVKRGIALTPVKFGISFTATHYNQAGALIHVYQDGTRAAEPRRHGDGPGPVHEGAAGRRARARRRAVRRARVGVRHEQGAERVADGRFVWQRHQRHGRACRGARRCANGSPRSPRSAFTARRRMSRFAGGRVSRRRARARIRRTRRRRVPRARPAVGDRLLRDAEDPLRPHDAVAAGRSSTSPTAPPCRRSRSTR